MGGFAQNAKYWLVFKVLSAVLILLPVQVFAQDTAATGGNLWVSPGAETALYSVSGVTFGGGLSLAYGRGTSVGIKTAYFSDFEGLLGILELNILLRFFFTGQDSGPFIQFTGGPALFFRQDSSIAIPAEWGMVSGGMALGWRFLLSEILFLEPSLRGGYPYIAGAGLSMGARF